MQFGGRMPGPPPSLPASVPAKKSAASVDAHFPLNECELRDTSAERGCLVSPKRFAVAPGLEEVRNLNVQKQRSFAFGFDWNCTIFCNHPAQSVCM